MLWGSEEKAMETDAGRELVAKHLRGEFETIILPVLIEAVRVLPKGDEVTIPELARRLSDTARDQRRYIVLPALWDVLLKVASDVAGEPGPELIQ